MNVRPSMAWSILLFFLSPAFFEGNSFAENAYLRIVKPWCAIHNPAWTANSVWIKGGTKVEIRDITQEMPEIIVSERPEIQGKIPKVCLGYLSRKESEVFLDPGSDVIGYVPQGFPIRIQKMENGQGLFETPFVRLKAWIPLSSVGQGDYTMAPIQMNDLKPITVRPPNHPFEFSVHLRPNGPVVTKVTMACEGMDLFSLVSQEERETAIFCDLPYGKGRFFICEAEMQWQKIAIEIDGFWLVGWVKEMPFELGTKKRSFDPSTGKKQKVKKAFDVVAKTDSTLHTQLKGSSFWSIKKGMRGRCLNQKGGFCYGKFDDGPFTVIGWIRMKGLKKE